MRPFVEVPLKIKQKDRRNRASKVIREKKIKRLVIIGVIAVIAIGIGIVVATSKIPLQASAAPTIDGIQCNPSEKFVLHNHVHIDIFINGQRYIVPVYADLSSIIIRNIKSIEIIHLTNNSVIRQCVITK